MKNFIEFALVAITILLSWYAHVSATPPAVSYDKMLPVDETINQRYKSDHLSLFHQLNRLKPVPSGYTEIESYFKEFLKDTEGLQKIFASNHIDPAAHNNIFLRLAVRYNMTETVKLLMNYRNVDPRVANQICIKLACSSGYDTIVETSKC